MSVASISRPFWPLPFGRGLRLARHTVRAAPAPAATATAAPGDTPDTPAAAQRVGVLDLYRLMWRYAEGARGYLLLSTALLVGSQVVKLLVPWMAAQAIDAIQKGKVAGISVAATWVAGIVGVFVASWMLHGPGRVIERMVGLRVRHVLADRLYARLAETPLAWRERHHAGELQHRMGQTTGALYDFTQNQFVYVQNVVNLLGPLIALMLLSTFTGGIAMLGFAFVAWVVVAFDKPLMRLAQQENAAERRYASALLDALSNVSTVMSLRLHASARRLLGRRLNESAAPLRRSIVLNEWKWCAVDMSGVLLVWLLVAVYAWEASAKGAVLIGSLFMVYQYAQQAGGVAGALAGNLQNFLRVRTDMTSADPIWKAPRHDDGGSVGTGARRELVPGMGDDWRRIDVRGVQFAHVADDDADGASRGGLRDVSLSLHRGERIALIGPSGSGKSTLLRVLAGLYEPQRGHVEVDGVACLGLRHLGASATLLPQEAQVFEATVRENIAFDLAHDDDAVAAAIRIGSFDTVLAGLPEGLDTPVSQGGANLSGGQRQRLCLARGALAAQGSPVLLLDEPTSALDPLSEALVHRRFDEAFPDACIVASVHRMSLLVHFDRVVLMDGGRVVDTGTVDELLARQPLFVRMVGQAQQAQESAPAPAIPGAPALAAA